MNPSVDPNSRAAVVPGCSVPMAECPALLVRAVR